MHTVTKTIFTTAKMMSRLLTALVLVMASLIAIGVSTEPSPASAATMTGFTQVSAGNQSTCAVKTDSTVWCWGKNSSGQLGIGNTTNQTRPVQVSLLSGVTSVGVHENFACALKSDGTVWCWGYNGMGQLGNGVTTNSNIPVKVEPLVAAVQISVGYGHACALKSDKTVRCWGWNVLQQLGDNTASTALAPMTPLGLSDVKEIRAGVFSTCALLDDANATVRCWGAGNNGGLGDGTATYSTSTKTSPTGILGVAKLGGSPGWGNECVVLTAGTVKCWGLNNSGQLGIGVSASSGADYWRLSPVEVSFPKAVTSISVGVYTPCAVLIDAKVMCWGNNGSGSIGDGSTTQRDVPTEVPNVTGVTQISSGYYHTCAVLTDTTIKCWGRGISGELGNATTTSSYTAVAVLAPAATIETPGSVVATATALTEKSINVSWAARTGASSYTVKIFDAAGTVVLGRKTGASGSSTTITLSTYGAMADNTSYQVSVTAIGDGGIEYNDSVESAKVSVTTNPPTLVISTPTVGLSGTAKSAFSLTVGGSGGIAPLTHALTGSLPEGLVFDTATGAITGTPTVAGSSVLSVTVTDARPVSASTTNFTLSVAYALTTISIALADVPPTYGSVDRITATTSQPGTVNFMVGGVSISGCGAVAAVSTSAFCDWNPSAVGLLQLSAALAPTDSLAYSSSISAWENPIVQKGTQANLTLTSTKGTFGTGLALATTGGSGSGTVTYAVTSAGNASCSISNATTLNASAPGTCTVTVTKAASTNYLVETSNATTVTFSRKDQAALEVSTITGDLYTGIIVAVTGGSGTGATTSTVTTGTAKCTLTSGVVTAKETGTCSLTVTKAADTTFLQESTTVTLTFTKAAPASGKIDSGTTGTAGTDIALSFTGGSGTGSVTYVVTSAGTAKCTITNGKLVATAAGTCTVTSTKKGDDTYDDQSVATEFTFTAGQAAVTQVIPQEQTVATTTTTVAPAIIASGKKKTATTTTTSSTTLPKPVLVKPSLVNTASSAGAATIGGKTAKAKTTRVNNQLVFTAGGFTVTLAGVNPDGTVIPLSNAGLLEVRRGDTFRLNAQGFAPESTVEIWMFSKTLHLGTITIGADGLMQSTFKVPKSITDGLHHLVMVGVDKAEAEAKFEVGMNVGVPTKQWWYSRWLLIIPIMLAVFAGFWLPTTARRRRRVA